MRCLLALILVCAGAVSGCADLYQRSAQREGDAIRDEKAAEVSEFRDHELVDPAREEVELAAEDAPVALPEVVNLLAAIRIATRNNRTYQTRRERFFLSALSLSLTRRNFLEPIFSGTVGYTASDGRERSFNDALTLGLGASQFLYTGGTLSVDTSAILAKSGKGGRDQDAVTTARVSLSQPLLRGAGHAIAFETLTQAERNTLYDARDFELFRQDFVIGIIQDYYNLVSQARKLDNTRNNIVKQQKAVRQAEALHRVGQGTKVDVFRAEQSYFESQNAVLEQEQAYEISLDRFKIQLGLPTEVELDIGTELPETLVEVDTTIASAVAAALNNRLDVLTQRNQVQDSERRLDVARNSLLPSFDFVVSYDTISDASRNFREPAYHDDAYAATLNLEIPLDRKRERNDYRAAMIDLDQSRRDLDEFEDNLILDVRDSLRTLRRRKSEIEVEEKNIASLRKQVRLAELANQAGTATNRDIVEAQDNLTRALNQQIDRYVSYEIARLTLLRQMGVLFVSEEGLIQE